MDTGNRKKNNFTWLKKFPFFVAEKTGFELFCPFHFSLQISSKIREGAMLKQAYEGYSNTVNERLVFSPPELFSIQVSITL